MAHASGTTIEKVDIFDQNDESSRILTINMPVKNTNVIGFSTETYFLTFDIGDFAQAQKDMGIKLADTNAFTYSAPHLANDVLFINISKDFARGPDEKVNTSYPYETGKAIVGGVTLKVDKLGGAEATTTTPGSKGITFIRLKLSTNKSFTTIFVHTAHAGRHSRE